MSSWDAISPSRVDEGTRIFLPYFISSLFFLSVLPEGEGGKLIPLLSNCCTLLVMSTPAGGERRTKERNSFPENWKRGEKASTNLYLLDASKLQRRLPKVGIYSHGGIAATKQPGSISLPGIPTLGDAKPRVILSLLFSFCTCVARASVEGGSLELSPFSSLRGRLE